jgi:hypothetical protein
MDLPSITQTGLEIALGMAALHSLHIVHGVGESIQLLFWLRHGKILFLA